MTDEVKVEQKDQEVKSSYSWYRDKKMMGMILLVVIVIFQIFAYLEVPVLSTIHGYTIGMLFGFYNPFFYFFMAYLSLIMIFGEKVRMPKWVKLNKLTYWIVAISVMFIGSSTGYYQTVSDGWTAIGGQPWGAFDTWFDKFTSSNSAWAPAQTDGGLVGVFLYALFASMLSGIGALIVAIAALVLSVSLIASGSFIGLYRQLHDLRKKTLESKEVSEDKLLVNDQKPKQVVESETKVSNDQVIKEAPKATTNQQVIDDLPFEDPFA